MRPKHSLRRRRRTGRKLAVFVLASASAYAALGWSRNDASADAVAGEQDVRVSRPRDLPREPALLNTRQVSRGLETRLQQMRQRHESDRAARQTKTLAASRGRAAAAYAPALRRDPVELSVQPLPATSE